MKEKIYIIEDDLTIQTQLKTLLSGNGYEVDAATDFSRIIEQLKAFAPHLVLLDIKLPGNSGFEVCSQIRSFSDIPIVFVTSSNTDMDELNSIMLGGDAFITKPYNTAILLAKDCFPVAAGICFWADRGTFMERHRFTFGKRLYRI